MSGECPGMPLTTGRKGDAPKGYGGSLGPDSAEVSPGYGDSGTASRFFPTFKSFDAAMAWLQKLIG